AAAGIRGPNPRDTLRPVLDAPDRDALLDWLRRRPLLHHDDAARRVLVHAGIPPHWSVADAARAAREVQDALAGPDWRDALAQMYGNEPARWSPRLARSERMRYTINALTRMRFCTYDGRLDLEHNGPPGSQPPGLVPWFDAPDRVAQDTHIVFGHWSALGLLRRPDVTGLDTGCVWGRALTAVPLDPPGEPIAVRCAGVKA